MKLNTVYHGDCLNVLGRFPVNSVDLIMTSPPYADARKNTYGGIEPDRYIEWFLPRAEQFKRVLKPSGSFVLNIKEKVVGGQRHTYVLKLILAMKEELGWRWVEEYIWHKKNPVPCGDVRWRLKDGWERLLHFTNAENFKIRFDNVKLPSRSPSSSYRPDGKELTAKSESGIKYHRRMELLEMCRPSNVVTTPVGGEGRGHSAIYPQKLPEFFVKLFTDANDIVLDPFCGSGTTMAAAQSLGRLWVGIDKDQSSVDLSRDRLNKTQPALIPA